MLLTKSREEVMSTGKNGIELRLSNILPPATEPARTIYLDINNLPNPVLFGITARYFNYDNVNLYFQITGSAPGYTFGTVNLGSLASGANAYQNLDQLISRAKPSSSNLTNGELQETITLILNAYTDSGYSNLKWTYQRTVTVYFINSADPSFTLLELDNFDDGTVDGWTAQIISGATSQSCAIASDYVLSAPYSLKTSNTGSEGSDCQTRTYKQFTIPNATKAFAIFDIRYSDISISGYGTVYGIKNIQIRINGTSLIFLGQPFDTLGTDYVPVNRWIRIVVPIPVNVTLTLDVFEEVYIVMVGGTATWPLWMDDFKIIYK
jgi:hypothetical protein